MCLAELIMKVQTKCTHQSIYAFAVHGSVSAVAVHAILCRLLHGRLKTYQLAGTLLRSSEHCNC